MLMYQKIIHTHMLIWGKLRVFISPRNIKASSPQMIMQRSN